MNHKCFFTHTVSLHFRITTKIGLKITPTKLNTVSFDVKVTQLWAYSS